MKQNYSFSRPLMPESHASGRLQFIDGAKGFALICVMLGHTEGGAVVTYIDNMLLPVFWVAAGYTSHPDFRISRRFRSLLLPYLFMSLACLIFMLLVNPASFGCGLFGAVALFVLFRLPFCSYMSRAFAFLNAKALYIFGLQLVFLEIGLRFGMHFGLPLWLTVSLQIIIAVAGGYLSGVIAGKLTDLFPKRG